MRFVFCVLCALIGAAAAAQDFTEDQIKQLALEAILERPEIIMEAVALLEQRDRDRRRAAASGAAQALASDPSSPILGNADGDVIIVEFFDYNCGFCRRAGPALQAVLARDSNVKVVMREWPVLGEASVYAARAALAARMQGKYEAFHWGLMASAGRASEASVLRLARSLGLDMEKLAIDMQSAAVNAHLQQTRDVAGSIGLTGTPAFVIGDHLHPGLLEQDQLEALIAQARGNP